MQLKCDLVLHFVLFVFHKSGFPGEKKKIYKMKLENMRKKYAEEL